MAQGPLPPPPNPTPPLPVPVLLLLLTTKERVAAGESFPGGLAPLATPPSQPDEDEDDPVHHEDDEDATTDVVEEEEGKEGGGDGVGEISPEPIVVEAPRAPAPATAAAIRGPKCHCKPGCPVKQDNREHLDRYFQRLGCDSPALSPAQDPAGYRRVYLLLRDRDSPRWLCSCMKTWSDKTHACKEDPEHDPVFPGGMLRPPELPEDPVAHFKVPGVGATGEERAVAEEVGEGPVVSDVLPAIEAALSTATCTITYIPKCVKAEFGRIMGDAFRAAARPGSYGVGGWALVLGTPLVLLGAASLKPRGRPRAKRQGSLSEVLRARLQEWQSLSFTGKLERIRALQPAPLSPVEQETRNRQLAIAMLEVGRLADAARHLVSTGLAKDTKAALRELQAKHPQAPLPLAPPLPADTPVPEASAEVVMRCLRSFKRRTAPGASGLRPEHLLAVVEGPVEFECERSLKALVVLVNLLLRGECSPFVMSHLAGAPLYALAKPNGSGIRPIAVGEVLRRLTAKVAIRLRERDMTSALSMHQFGVGIRNGAEGIVHGMRAAVQAQTPGDGRAVLKVDFSNAFNLVDRQTFLDLLADKVPTLLPWVASCYTVAGRLRYNGSTILSTSGVQQGDPLGPFLFSLALDALVLDIQRLHPTLLMAWYLDDGVVMAPPAVLASVLQLIEERGPALGLQLNMGKCEVWSKDPTLDLSCIPACVIRVQGDGFELLGSSVGGSESAEGVAFKRVAKIQAILERVHSLDWSQGELSLIRGCVGFPKIAFLFRTCPPELIPSAIRVYDRAIDKALSFVLSPEAVANPNARLQMGLPASKGGLSVPLALHHAGPAYLASFTSSLSIQRKLIGDDAIRSPCALGALEAFNCMLEGWNMPDEAWPGMEAFDAVLAEGQEMEVILEGEGAAVAEVPVPDALTLEAILSRRKAQRFLSGLVHKRVFHHLFSQAGAVDKARLLSLLLPYAGAWTIALPLKDLGLHMPDQQFRTACLLRVGMPVYVAPSDRETWKCRSCKRGMHDRHGHHATSCSGRYGTYTRHEMVKGVLLKFARESGYPGAEAEPSGIDRDSRKRPADVYIPGWWGGGPAWVDVAVTAPTGDSYKEGAAKALGHAAAQREADKHAAYDSLADKGGATMVPFVLEHYGGFGKGAVGVVKTLAKGYARHKCLTLSEATSRIIQRFSVTAQRALAYAVEARQFDAKMV